jgi:hypothetical protein
VGYLLVVLVVSIVGIGVVLVRRRPRTMGANIDRFARARSAISPEASGSVPRPASSVVRPDQRRRHQAGLGD